MMLTNHAQSRFQQRGFDEAVIILLDQLGTCEHVPGGALKLCLPRKRAKRAINDIIRISKRIIHAIEKSSNRAVIMDIREDEAITVMINIQ